MTALTFHEGRSLLPAVAVGIAREVGARILLIKGPVAQHHGLRPASREYVDIDVLVEPTRFEELRRGFERHGWSYPGGEMPSMLGLPHAYGLRHPLWPLELDLHQAIPGMFAEPAEVFEVLWADRVEVRCAGIGVPAAGLVGSALIGALHALRAPSDPGNVAELEELRRRVNQLPDSAAERLAEQAGAVRAMASAAPFLTAVGVGGERSVDDETELHYWRVYTTSGADAGVIWLASIRRAPWQQRPRLVMRALLGASEFDLRRAFPEAPPGRRGVWLARWWRLKRAVPQLPSAVIAVLGRGRSRA